MDCMAHEIAKHQTRLSDFHFHQLSVSHMVVYIRQCRFFSLPHRLLLLFPQVCSLCLCPHSFPANRVINIQLIFKLFMYFMPSSEYMTYVTMKKGKKKSFRNSPKGAATSQPQLTVAIWDQCCESKLFKEVRYMDLLFFLMLNNLVTNSGIIETLCKPTT